MMDIKEINKNLEYLRDSCAEVGKVLEQTGESLLENRIILGVLKFELITAIEALCNILSHLLIKVKKAGQSLLISERLSDKLKGFAKLKNLLVHRYCEVDDVILLREVKANRENVKSFYRKN